MVVVGLSGSIPVSGRRLAPARAAVESAGPAAGSAGRCPAGEARAVVFEDGVEDAGGGGSVESDRLVVARMAGVGEDEARVGLGVGAYGRPVPDVLGRGVDGGVLDQGRSGSLVPAGGECCSGGLEIHVRHGRLTACSGSGPCCSRYCCIWRSWRRSAAAMTRWVWSGSWRIGRLRAGGADPRLPSGLGRNLRTTPAWASSARVGVVRGRGPGRGWPLGVGWAYWVSPARACLLRSAGPRRRAVGPRCPGRGRRRAGGRRPAGFRRLRRSPRRPGR
ncbi:Hypothetical protein SCLAV_p0198 (plasmid) [Streptomyces clavuligerus]|uniref:Uncharacterized protein n=1 Tax=Streptomyces clavuligerus TaxID=1901 RepID=D5SIE6_STRCL|nr:Hypothetical protein SCLAV_p0198 [Streptomyces clavuligerus]